MNYLRDVIILNQWKGYENKLIRFIPNYNLIGTNSIDGR